MGVPRDIESIDREFRSLGLEPLSPFTRATDLRSCRCTTCGTIRQVRLSNLRKGGTPCRWCHGWETWLPWSEAARDRARVWRSLGSPEESLQILRAMDLAPITAVGDLYEPVGVVCINCGETLVVVPERILSSKMRRGWYDCQRCAADYRRQLRYDASALFAANGLELQGRLSGEYVPQHTTCVACGSPRRVSYHELETGTAPECWTCKTGIRVDEPHRVYLFHFPALGVMKIGITHNRDDRRLSEHAFAGGELLGTVVVSDREAARLLEKVVAAIYAPWVADQIGPADFPQGGWTETWSDDAPPLDLSALAGSVL